MGIFNQDQPADQLSLNAIVDEFDKGHFIALVPSIVITEIAAGPDERSLHTFEQFLLRVNVEQIDLTTRIAREAGQLRRAVLNARMKLKPLDAIIVASANHVRADIVVTCDHDIERMTGLYGLSPRIGRPAIMFDDQWLFNQGGVTP